MAYEDKFERKTWKVSCDVRSAGDAPDNCVRIEIDDAFTPDECEALIETIRIFARQQRPDIRPKPPAGSRTPGGDSPWSRPRGR